MAFDFTTEAIAHFIGSFKQVIEDTRLRTNYDSFDGDGPAYDDGKGLANIKINVSAPLKTEGFDPGISYKVQLLPLPDRFSPTSVLLNPGYDPVLPYAVESVSADPFSSTALPAGLSGGFSILPPPVPPSYATVVYQHSMLSDADSIFGLEAGALLAPEAQAQALEWLTDVALEMTGPEIPEVPDSGADIATTAYETYDAVTMYEAAEPGDAHVSVSKSEFALGTHVDGETSDTLPELEAVLPELPEKDDEEGPAHDVITGGNTLVNQAFVSFSMTDSPVMAAMGDSVSLSSISQTNVISDLDTINGALQDRGPDANTVSNIGSILRVTSSPEDPDAREEADEEDTPMFPSIAALARIEGDVVNFNYLHQQNLIADGDVVSTALSAQRTFIESGGNLMVNAVSLVELSFLYDLIMVAGDIVNVSIINQMNVLLDDDFITYPDDDAWSITGNDNVLWNQAAVEAIGVDSYREMAPEFEALGNSLAAGSDAVPGSILRHEAFAGDDVLSVLHIDGDLISLQVVDQINIASDVDQLFLDAGGDEATVVAGANALINIAAILEFGVDSEIHVGGEAYSDALMHQAGLIVSEDSNALPEGGGLVTEAVAFLMDDVETQAEESGGRYAGYVSEDELGNDPMGGMVA